MAQPPDAEDRTPLPPGTEVMTEAGSVGAADVGALVVALDAMQSSADEDAFVTVSRPDGAFLQMRRLTLELGDGTGANRQGSLPSGLRELFVSFARGERAWDHGMTWSEPSPTPQVRGLARVLPGWLVAVALILLFGGLFVLIYVLTRPSR
jgi:hypothetical protein